jgi:hypothetical protein
VFIDRQHDNNTADRNISPGSASSSSCRRLITVNAKPTDVQQQQQQQQQQQMS